MTRIAEQRYADLEDEFCWVSRVSGEGPSRPFTGKGERLIQASPKCGWVGCKRPAAAFAIPHVDGYRPVRLNAYLGSLAGQSDDLKRPNLRILVFGVQRNLILA